jgi:hypothetical protein
MKTTIDHRSGRFDRDPKHLAADLLDASRVSSIVTLTEQGGLSDKRRAALRFPAWAWFHADERGADDCAVLWDSSQWVLDGWARATPITTVVWRRVAKYGGNITPATHATVVPLRSRTGGVRVVPIVVHMPTRSTVLRRKAWASCINGLVRLVKQIRKADPRAQIALCWDINADWSNARDRALLVRTARRLGLAPTWEDIPAACGTHGSRLIDAIWTDAEVHDAEVLSQTAASDHRPIRAVLNITGKNGNA